MRSELPLPDDILEELADKTAACIDRMAPVAFNDAFREMTRYHRFLLELSASKTEEGEPFSYAEIAGNGWHAPHRDWTRQYRRLFERAADRIPDDDRFIRTLAHVPSRLLGREVGEPPPPGVVTAILDLVPVLVHRLEAWVTKRTTLEVGADDAAQPRLILAGSDAKAYANVLPELIGAWEDVLRYSPSLYGWEEQGDATAEARWDALRATWSLIWQHLSNTAYCLAAAVWNEDHVAAPLFREALVRWPDLLRHSIEGDGEMRHRRLIFPSLLGLPWAGASEKVQPLAHNYMPAPTPDGVFHAIVRGAHVDVLTLTAALLTFWTINEKQASDIGGRTARALIQGDTAAEDPDEDRRQGIGFRSFALDLVRMEMAGARYDRASYAADLSHLVEVLDNMTERRVVPGRVYTPSTLHGREELLIPVLSILLAVVPDEGDEGLVERLVALAREEEILPEGDKSLRDVVDELNRLRGTLEQPLPQLAKGVAIFAPQKVLNLASARLGEIFEQARVGIEAERLKRLDARSPDPGKLERIRAAIETGLLTNPPKLAYFRDVATGKTEDAAAEWRDITFSGISKAQLVEPPMESTVSNLEEWFVSGARERAGNHAWRVFLNRPRREEQIRSKIEDAAFWREIDPFVRAVGSDAVLLVSHAAEGRTLRRFLYASPEERPALRFERRDVGTRGNYLITLQGVDIFATDLAPGTAWLFSAKALRSVRYGAVDAADRYVTIAFEPGENRDGKLRLRVRQHLEWDGSPLFELRTLDPLEGNQP